MKVVVVVASSSDDPVLLELSLEVSELGTKFDRWCGSLLLLHVCLPPLFDLLLVLSVEIETLLHLFQWLHVRSHDSALNGWC